MYIIINDHFILFYIYLSEKPSTFEINSDNVIYY